MSRRQVIVAEAIADAGIKTLERTADVVDMVGQSRDALLSVMPSASALIVRSATKVDQELLEAAPNLEVVGRAGIGVDNIDLDAATERGIGTPASINASVAPQTVAIEDEPLDSRISETRRSV